MLNCYKSYSCFFLLLCLMQTADQHAVKTVSQNYSEFKYKIAVLENTLKDLKNYFGIIL